MARGWSQTVAARRCGIGKTTWGRAEAGEGIGHAVFARILVQFSDLAPWAEHRPGAVARSRISRPVPRRGRIAGLRALRESAGLTVSAAARAAGVARSTWSRAEEGVPVTEAVHQRIAQAMPGCADLEPLSCEEHDRQRAARRRLRIWQIPELRQIRELRAWSLSEAARRCGVSRGSWTAAERGSGVSEGTYRQLSEFIPELRRREDDWHSGSPWPEACDERPESLDPALAHAAIDAGAASAPGLCPHGCTPQPFPGKGGTVKIFVQDLDEQNFVICRMKDGASLAQVTKRSECLVVRDSDQVFAKLHPACPPQNVLYVLIHKLKQHGYEVARIVR